jgi:hypothetical protein
MWFLQVHCTCIVSHTMWFSVRGTIYKATVIRIFDDRLMQLLYLCNLCERMNCMPAMQFCVMGSEGTLHNNINYAQIVIRPHNHPSLHQSITLHTSTWKADYEAVSIQMCVILYINCTIQTELPRHLKQRLIRLLLHFNITQIDRRLLLRIRASCSNLTLLGSAHITYIKRIKCRMYSR